MRTSESANAGQYRMAKGSGVDKGLSESVQERGLPSVPATEVSEVAVSTGTGTPQKPRSMLAADGAAAG